MYVCTQTDATKHIPCCTYAHKVKTPVDTHCYLCRDGCVKCSNVFSLNFVYFVSQCLHPAIPTFAGVLFRNLLFLHFLK